MARWRQRSVEPQRSVCIGMQRAPHPILQPLHSTGQVQRHIQWEQTELQYRGWQRQEFLVQILLSAHAVGLLDPHGYPSNSGCPVTDGAPPPLLTGGASTCSPAEHTGLSGKCEATQPWASVPSTALQCYSSISNQNPPKQ